VTIPDEQLLVEQAPPEDDRFVGEVGIDLVFDPSTLIRASPPTVRFSGSRAKAQKRSQEHMALTPEGGRCVSQSSILECGSERCCWLL
jgi:hypothetical protein